MVFKHPPAKRFSRTKLFSFVEAIKKSSVRSKCLMNTGRGRIAFPLSKSVLATLREFSSASAAKRYLKNTAKFEALVAAKKPKHFVVRKMEIFGRIDNKLVERVYTSPTLHDIIHHNSSAYFGRFMRRMKAKGVSEKEIGEASIFAYAEIRQIGNESRKIMRMRGGAPVEQNILIHDYDPITKRILVGFIDLEAPMSKHVK